MARSGEYPETKGRYPALRASCTGALASPGCRAQVLALLLGVEFPIRSASHGVISTCGGNSHRANAGRLQAWDSEIHIVVHRCFDAAGLRDRVFSRSRAGEGADPAPMSIRGGARLQATRKTTHIPPSWDAKRGVRFPRWTARPVSPGG